MKTETTAFMLYCTIGLTLMISGVALFYGGIVSVRSSTKMMMTFGACAIAGVLWVLFGFSMTFGTSNGGFVGSFTEFAGMKALLGSNTTISGLRVSIFLLLQVLFAATIAALISGAAVDRMKVGAWMVFTAAWTVFAYFPVAHWVFSFDGVVTHDSVGDCIVNKLRPSNTPVARPSTSMPVPLRWQSPSCSASLRPVTSTTSSAVERRPAQLRATIARGHRQRRVPRRSWLPTTPLTHSTADPSPHHRPGLSNRPPPKTAAN
jgi:hypothetical protein